MIEKKENSLWWKFSDNETDYIRLKSSKNTMISILIFKAVGTLTPTSKKTRVYLKIV